MQGSGENYTSFDALKTVPEQEKYFSLRNNFGTLTLLRLLQIHMKNYFLIVQVHTY